MEATFIKIFNPADASFAIWDYTAPGRTYWHYHPEFEIAYIIKGRGTRFVGDNIASVEQGEILLFGPNLPHAFMWDKPAHKSHTDNTPHSFVVHFDKDFLGPEVWKRSEFLPILNLLNMADRGLKFSGEFAERAACNLIKLKDEKGVKKLMYLLCMLEELSFVKDVQYISTPGFIKHYDETDERINRIYEYTINHFREDISLTRIAREVYLSQSAFCRFFKSKTRKTYSSFLTEVRIGYACKLILEDKKNISEICYDCGYKNLSNFNRHFKHIMFVTPSDYQKKFVQAGRIAVNAIRA